MRRRQILIWADAVQGVLLLTIPVAALFGLLRIEQLYGLALVIGAITVVAAVAQQSFLPSLVARRELPAANSRLEASRSFTGIVGPGLGGALVQVLTAPVAILVDSVSFFVSAALLRSLRTAEPPPLPEGDRPRMRAQIAEGLRIVLGHRLLRPLMSCGMTHNFFRRMFEAIFVLYLVNELGLDPIVLGIVVAAGGPGALLGGVAGSLIGLRPTLFAAAIAVLLAFAWVGFSPVHHLVEQPEPEAL